MFFFPRSTSQVIQAVTFLSLGWRSPTTSKRVTFSPSPFVVCFSGVVAAGFWDEHWRNSVAFFFAHGRENMSAMPNGMCRTLMVGRFGAWADLPIKFG